MEDAKQPDDSEKKSEKQTSTKTDFGSLIPEEVEPLLNEFPEDKQEIVRELISLSIRRYWKGPLPPPDVLKNYNQAFDGGAKAIFEQTKKQQDHRMDLEKTTITRQMNQSGSGQILAFILALVLFAIAGFLAYSGHETVAGIAFGLDVIGLTAVFIAGRHNIKIDLQRMQKSSIDDNNSNSTNVK